MCRGRQGHVCVPGFVAGMTDGQNHILVGEVLHPLGHFCIPPLDELQQLHVSCTEDYTSGHSNSCVRCPDWKFHYVPYLWKYIESFDPANTTTPVTYRSCWRIKTRAPSVFKKKKKKVGNYIIQIKYFGAKRLFQFQLPIWTHEQAWDTLDGRLLCIAKASRSCIFCWYSVFASFAYFLVLKLS